MNTQVKTRRGGVQSCIFGNMFDRSPPHSQRYVSRKSKQPPPPPNNSLFLDAAPRPYKTEKAPSHRISWCPHRFCLCAPFPFSGYFRSPRGSNLGGMTRYPKLVSMNIIVVFVFFLMYQDLKIAVFFAKIHHRQGFKINNDRSFSLELILQQITQIISS